MKRFKWDSKYLYWGVTAFLVIAAGIVFFQVIRNLGWLRDGLMRLLAILSPFIWGLVIAYLLSPLMNVYSRYLFTPLAERLLRNNPNKAQRVPNLARGLSVLFCVITLLVLVGGLLSLVIPQLYSSIERIVVNSSSYISRADAWLNRTLEDYPQLRTTITNNFGDLSNGIISWASDIILPELGSVVTNVTANVYAVVRDIYNVLIGIIVSVYVLYSKELFGARCKKLIYCILSLEAAEKLLRGLRFSNRVFMSFLSGKILDSLIIGILCFIACSIMKMPYSLLVSVIVGVTNIIPFFGPFIGAIPSAVIILTESPLKMLIFLIFIVVLQQFDGNILGPKILGNSVGINGFWILFSIILGAGLFGFGGMLLGVPVFVVVYTLLRSLARRKLQNSGLPEDTGFYFKLRYFDPETGEAVTELPEEEQHKRRKKKPARWADRKARRSRQDRQPGQESQSDKKQKKDRED